MAKVLVVTHGPLSQALLDAAEMILGDVGAATALGFQPGDGPEDLTEQLMPLVATAEQSGGVLCLTDLQGGTPARIAASLVQTAQIDVVCGVNLPMVLEVLTAGDVRLSELTALAVEAGRDSVIDLGGELRRQLDPSKPQEGAAR